MSADNWADCPWCGAPGLLREDYEIGIYKGVYHMRYEGECQLCKQTFKDTRSVVIVHPRELEQR